MAYQGNERRIHRVFVTRNTEYHLRRNTCVGVRDRESGSWLPAHFAIERALAGSIKFFESGAMTATRELPDVGESLYFEEDGRDLVTSAVVSVERPGADVVAQYPVSQA